MPQMSPMDWILIWFFFFFFFHMMMILVYFIYMYKIKLFNLININNNFLIKWY